MCGVADQLGAAADAEAGGVQHQVVILRRAPGAVGVALAMGAALAVDLADFVGRLLGGHAVIGGHAVDAVLFRGTDEHMQAVFKIPQDIVGAAADDHAVFLLRNILDHLALRHKQHVCGGQRVFGVGKPLTGQIGKKAEGGALLVGLDEVGGEAAFLGGQFDQFFIIK